jgi:hypothetical protein
MKKKQEEGQMHLALLLNMSSQTNTHHWMKGARRNDF